MKQPMQHFSSVQEFHEYMGWPSPENPMFSIIAFDTFGADHRPSSPAITTDFYMITLKYVVSGELIYGRTSFDFSRGTMIFNAPRQSLQWDEMTMEKKGFMILIHEDYLRGHAIAEKIKHYGYFSYTVNEALHLSPKEESVMEGVYESLASEYNNNQDEHSKRIILGLMDTLLVYAERYYRRQFIGRKEMEIGLDERFKELFSDYVASGSLKIDGAPSINLFARKMGVSPRYLSDSLKNETGKTAQEHIHILLIDEAKNLLLEPGITVSEVAYKLGFDYPQYFSRLFKKKVGMSPKAFIENH